MAESINASLVVAAPADGCEPIWDNAEAVKGNIVVVDRGACPFADKATHAQAAGAVAVVIANNQPGATFAMPGNFSGVSIPAVLIMQEDGARLKDGANAGMTATLEIGPPSKPCLHTACVWVWMRMLNCPKPNTCNHSLWAHITCRP
jgi:hypothetical protein